MKLSTSLHGIDEHDGELVAKLLGLPHKILSHNEVDGLEQMVLHELGHDSHFGLSKAGYLIDNPEFNCLKGIAGYCKSECPMHKLDVWQDPKLFADDMKDAHFHRQISHFLDNSLTRVGADNLQTDLLLMLGNKMGMTTPGFITWKMKHGNNGILLFEENGMPHARRRDLLHHFVALLSLC